MLPPHEIREGQQGLAELLIEPEAEVVQGYLGGQVYLKALQSRERSQAQRNTWL